MAAGAPCEGTTGQAVKGRPILGLFRKPEEGKGLVMKDQASLFKLQKGLFKDWKGDGRLPGQGLRPDADKTRGIRTAPGEKPEIGGSCLH